MNKKILLVKFSSLGDVIHSFPAVSEMIEKGYQISWAVEEAYAPLVSQYPNVKEVIAVPLRRLVKESKFWFLSKEWKEVQGKIKAEKYDKIIDAQGLIKSAIFSSLCRGEKNGYNRQSVREGFASFFYDRRYFVDKNLHASERTRILCSKALDYRLPLFKPENYPILKWQGGSKNLFFFHGTTWVSKTLPFNTWKQIADFAKISGYKIKVFYSNANEKLFCEVLSKTHDVLISPPKTIWQIAQELENAAGVIGVDTGLTHLSDNMGVPTLGIFGATDANLVGLRGKHSANLSVLTPCKCKDCTQHGAEVANSCMSQFSAYEIWDQWTSLILKI